MQLIFIIVFVFKLQEVLLFPAMKPDDPNKPQEEDSTKPVNGAA